MPARVSTIPASRNSVAETSPWLTACMIGAVAPELVEREEAEHDQAHLRQRRVRDHDAEVGRAEGEQRAVDEADAPRHEISAWKSSTGAGNFAITIRRKPNTAAFETTPESIAATSGGDSRYASTSQPWNGKIGALTANAARKPRKTQSFARGARVDERERALREPEDDDRREHQQRAGHRVDDERDRRADAPRPAPDADQDVERDQHRLEEDVEEEQVLRGEDADDRAGEEEQQPVVDAAPLAATQSA